MRSEWQLQDAKNGLSQLIKAAMGGKPQLVALHGKLAAVVVSADEYAHLTKLDKGKLSAALLRPDIAADEADFSRDRASDARRTW